jgi:hypothetical protein
MDKDLNPKTGNNKKPIPFTDPLSKLTVSQDKKPGLVKRFLDWLARGAAASRKNVQSCPT